MRRISIILGALITTCLLATGCGSESSSDGNGNSSSDSGAAEYSAGDKVASIDGISYQVMNSSTSRDAVDEMGLGKPKGIYVFVQSKVYNEGSTSHSFSETATKYVASDGKEHKALSQGDLNEVTLPAGLSKEVGLIFDVPGNKWAGGKLRIEEPGGRSFTIGLGI